MTHLEIEIKTGTVNVCKRNAINGIVTREVCIGSVSSDESSEERCKSAEEIAKNFGWIAVDEWVSGETHQWVECQAKPVSVSFVSESAPDNAVSLAKSAGVDAEKLLYEEPYDAESGKIRVWFEVAEPKGWTWEENLPWGNWFDEE